MVMIIGQGWVRQQMCNAETKTTGTQEIVKTNISDEVKAGNRKRNRVCESQTGSPTSKSRQEEREKQPNGEKTIPKTNKQKKFQTSNLEVIKFLKKVVFLSYKLNSFIANIRCRDCTNKKKLSDYAILATLHDLHLLEVGGKNSKKVSKVKISISTLL